ncbi:aminofutalosine synthase MqnE [Methanosarcinales archaeon]|nr:MAG: aminofutalosine synthase MqnE [Methanosarcinales archaeon]
MESLWKCRGLIDLFSDKELEPIIDKVLSMRPLDAADGITILKSTNLFLLGTLADYVRRQTVGENVTFAFNMHIDYTNICDSKCKFCAYYREPTDNDAYAMNLEEILKKAGEANRMGVRELHIVGALNPDLDFSFFENMIEQIHTSYPQMGIKAFTAVEIAYIAQNEEITVREVLKRLKDAGLTCMPGGGAEIFSKRVRAQLCPEKISGERWLEIMEEAHTLGIPTNATMLYGHIETPAEIVDHLLRLRDLQRKTHGFQAFIPLSFHPQNTKLESSIPEPTGFDDLKMILLSRLMLTGYIDNIKAYWIMLGEKLAQIALLYGANDLDGTVIEERITHATGTVTAEYLPVEQLINLIKGAGRIPVERTATYDIVKVYR